MSLLAFEELDAEQLNARLDEQLQSYRLLMVIPHKWKSTMWSRSQVCKFCDQRGMQESVHVKGLLCCDTCNATMWERPLVVVPVLR